MVCLFFLVCFVSNVNNSKSLWCKGQVPIECIFGSRVHGTSLVSIHETIMLDTSQGLMGSCKIFD